MKVNNESSQTADKIASQGEQAAAVESMPASTSPLRTKPFPSWPQWGEAEEEMLRKVLYAGQWGTLGDQAMSFASRFAAFQDCQYGIAVNNGTQALEIAMRGLGLGFGDEVILPAYTFIATASAVCACGITPVFADIDPATMLLDAADAERRITPRTRAIIAVHYAGRPCDMDAIMAVASAHGLKVIEDCAQAHGASFRGRKVGSFGDVGTFSFQETKNLPAGEGGMIVTNNKEVFAECWHYHTSGRALEGSAELGGLVLMGTNARMAEWEAGILHVQMDKLEGQMAKRTENARLLRELLKDEDWLELPAQDERITCHAYHLFTMTLKKDVLGMSREEWIRRVSAEGIPVSASYNPLYRDVMFSSANFRRMCAPVSGSAVTFASCALESGSMAASDDCKAVEEAAPWNVYLTQNVLLAEAEDMQDIVKVFRKVLGR
ncbi:MAG: DegT/DnrJ/EryC1/StrS family aminotransferase [Lachnospiraceae bacterium]|nr:DegT/DnrJ/EryC1/StrS family aminotransferase [Lachnospiraceae bacterium]